MKNKFSGALGTVLVAIGTIIGVLVSSQFFSGDSLRTSVWHAITSGVIAAILFAITDYIRRK